MKQFAKATWKGSGLEGKGCLTVQSETMLHAAYTFNSRFNSESGTNTEELLAAAHASDFTMKLSFILAEWGFTPVELNTTCFINFDKGKIVSSTLEVLADVPGIDLNTFNEYVADANKFCPISCILKIDIKIQTSLVGTGNCKTVVTL